MNVLASWQQRMPERARGGDGAGGSRPSAARGPRLEARVARHTQLSRRLGVVWQGSRPGCEPSQHRIRFWKPSRFRDTAAETGQRSRFASCALCRKSKQMHATVDPQAAGTAVASTTHIAPPGVESTCSADTEVHDTRSPNANRPGSAAPFSDSVIYAI